MEIAIIDDGVSGLYFPDLAFQMKVEGGQVVSMVDRSERWEHGSTCAALIRKYAPEARLGSIQILDKATERGNIADFLAALAWCVERRVKLVHASLGSIASEDYELLLRAVTEARRRGVIVVAAYKNGLRCAYPASLEDAIGVKTDEDLREDAYRANPNVAVDGAGGDQDDTGCLSRRRMVGGGACIVGGGAAHPGDLDDGRRARDVL